MPTFSQKYRLYKKFVKSGDIVDIAGLVTKAVISARCGDYRHSYDYLNKATIRLDWYYNKYSTELRLEGHNDDNFLAESRRVFYKLISTTREKIREKQVQEENNEKR